MFSSLDIGYHYHSPVRRKNGPVVLAELDSRRGGLGKTVQQGSVQTIPYVKIMVSGCDEIPAVLRKCVGTIIAYVGLSHWKNHSGRLRK